MKHGDIGEQLNKINSGITFDCSICRNSKICVSKPDAAAIKDEVGSIEHKHPNFFGGIIVRCDYFIPTNVGMRDAQR